MGGNINFDFCKKCGKYCTGDEGVVRERVDGVYVLCTSCDALSVGRACPVEQGSGEGN